MRLQKMHPDFDVAMADILRADPNGVILRFEDPVIAMGRVELEKRFLETIPKELHGRICFHPWITRKDELINVIAMADVVLDPFHFGIGSTAALTFISGTPIVTLEGEFMRGRIGASFCKLLEIKECITHSRENYVRQAVSIATDPAYRDKLKQQILANSSAVFDNWRPVHDFVNLMIGWKASSTQAWE